jgi:hypothetical protein
MGVNERGKFVPVGVVVRAHVESEDIIITEWKLLCGIAEHSNTAEFNSCDRSLLRHLKPHPGEMKKPHNHKYSIEDKAIDWKPKDHNLKI